MQKIVRFHSIRSTFEGLQYAYMLRLTADLRYQKNLEHKENNVASSHFISII